MTRSQPTSAIAPSRREAGSPPDHRGTRRATISAASYNSESRSVDAVLSAGTRVRRYFGFEELDLTAEAVDLSRAQSGHCPLLNTHNQFDIAAILGTVDSVRLQGNLLTGRINFADTAPGREAEGMVSRGEITGISIGYTVQNWQLVETTEDDREVWRAARWQLLEVSLVPVPADPAAGFRSEAVNPDADRAIQEDEDMLTRNLPSAPSPSAASAAIRPRDISAAARNAGLDIVAVDDLLARHEAAPFSRDGLMAEIGRRFAERDQAGTIRTVNRNSPYPAQAPQMAARMEGALFARMSGQAPADESREFMGLSMIGMARALLEERGENVRWLSDSAVVERAVSLSTSDFPSLLQGSGSRFLMTAYEEAASAIKRVARERTAVDFRDINLLSLSNAPELEKVLENGELKYGAFSENKETYRLATFAKIFGLSRQAIVNDDLGAFRDSLAMMARAAAEKEASELAALLNANSGAGPTMTGDSNALFHTDHGNIAGSGAAISVAALSDARLALRNQKDRDGKTFLNVVPKTLMVAPAQETLGEQVLTQLQANAVAEVNPFGGKLELAVEPRLTGTGWRLFADPTQAPVLEYAYLDSARGPQLLTREGWTVLGTEFRVVLDFGCAAVDYRGAYYNPGV